MSKYFTQGSILYVIGIYNFNRLINFLLSDKGMSKMSTIKNLKVMLVEGRDILATEIQDDTVSSEPLPECIFTCNNTNDIREAIEADLRRYPT